MIPLMLAALSALASSNIGIDVLVKPITAQTNAVVVDTETLDIFGRSITERIRPDRGGLGNRGLLLELTGQVPAIAPNRWVLSAGWSHVRNRYTFSGLTFAPTVTDSHLMVGLLPWFGQHQVPDVDGYMILLAGLRGETIAARPIAPPSLAMAPQLSFGMGIATRKLPTRLRAEVRADLVPHFEPGNGRVELPVKALVWKWYPGSAAISILIGVGFGGAERDRIVVPPPE